MMIEQQKKIYEQIKNKQAGLFKPTGAKPMPAKKP